jgi:hypothetical protein
MFFLKKLLSKKYLFPVLALVLIVSILAPFSVCFAFEFPDIWGAVSGAVSGAGKDLANAILGSIFGLLLSVPLFVLNVALDILNWVASGDFLSVSFTGADNPVVTAGWGFVRNLANVVLIFGLVIIALSIILGYQETQAKKTLVNFILIAALINFTPVICGLVIDLSKIIMDLLLRGGVPPTLTTLIASKVSPGGTGLADIPTFFVLAGFCIFASIIYILFALLFLVRIVYLWILVILSPIAFATKVLPGNKYIMKIFPRVCTWDGWWDDFMQWTFIGIPAAGAIYLSNVAMYTIAQNPSAIVSAPSGNALSGTLALLFSYTIPFVILVVGFFISLDSGGVAGSTIKGLAKKAWGATGGAAIGATTGAVTGYAAGRASALGTWTKEGAVGTLGAAISKNKSAFDAGDREQARKDWEKWKTNAVDTVGRAPVIGRAVPGDKLSSDNEFDKYNKNRQRLGFAERQKMEKELIKKDAAKFLEDGKTDAKEYQRRLIIIRDNDDKTKDYKKIKTTAAIHTKGNVSNAGTLDWEKEYNINIKDELQNKKAKELKAYNMPAESIAHRDVANAIQTKELERYIIGLNDKNKAAVKAANHKNVNTSFNNYAIQRINTINSSLPTTTNPATVKALTAEKTYLMQKIHAMRTAVNP